MLGIVIGSSKGDVRTPVGRAKRRAVAAAVSLVAIAAAAGPALGQGFDNEWIVGEGGTVNTMAQITGVKYIGGTFDYLGPNTGGAAQITSASAAAPTGIPRFEGKIHAIAIDPNGGWWIGGELIRVANTTVSNLVHINSNGTLSPAFLPNFDGPVFALAADASFVYVGGDFDVVAGATRNNFARFSSATGAVSLNGMTANTNGAVRAVLIGLANDAYIGGEFTTVSSASHERVAQLTTVGSTGVTSWCGGSGNGANGAVLALANDWNGGAVFLGGAFTQFNGTTKNRVCKVQTGGTLSSWGAGANNTVRALAVDVATKEMFMGGDFTTVEGSTRHHLARVDQTSTGALKPWNPSCEGDSTPVSSLHIFDDFLYVGGDFTELDNLPGYRGLGRVAFNSVNPGIDNGEADPNWKILATGNVAAVAGNSSGNAAMFVGGDFKSVGGQRHVNIARLTQDVTGAWVGDGAWSPEVGATSDFVNALSVADSFLFVGGGFSSVTNSGTVTQINNACKLHLSGTGALQVWNPSPNGPVRALFAVGGSQIVVGGSFSTIGGTNRNNLARVGTSSSATVDSGWNPNVTDAGGSGGGAAVNAILNAGSGAVAVGGTFERVSGATRIALAVVSSSGSATSFDAGLSNGGSVVEVHALAPNGSNLFVGGRFDEANLTKSATRDGRMNVCEVQFSDGTLTSWIAGASTSFKGVDGTVRALATVTSSSAVFVGGDFLHVGPSTARNRVARISTSSGAVSTTWIAAFGPSSVSSDTVKFIASDGATVEVAGAFSVTSSSGSTTTPTTSRRSLALVNPAQ